MGLIGRRWELARPSAWPRSCYVRWLFPATTRESERRRLTMPPSPLERGTKIFQDIQLGVARSVRFGLYLEQRHRISCLPASMGYQQPRLPVGATRKSSPQCLPRRPLALYTVMDVAFRATGNFSLRSTTRMIAWDLQPIGGFCFILLLKWQRIWRNYGEQHDPIYRVGRDVPPERHQPRCRRTSAATNGPVTVTDGGVTSSGVTFSVIEAATVTGLSPTSGQVGAVVAITGTGFGALEETVPSRSMAPVPVDHQLE